MTSHVSDTRSYVNLNPGYRGRVRTGCLTCRGKKVKCDEERPACLRCSRLKRTCIYTSIARSTSEAHSHSEEMTTDHDPEESEILLRQSQVVTTPYSPREQEQMQFISPDCNLNASFEYLNTPASNAEPFSSNTPTSQDAQASVLTSPAALSLMTSQDIFLSTTIDHMAAAEARSQASFCDFVLEVKPPIISNIDFMNWNHFQLHVVKIAYHNELVAAGVSAAQLLYKAQAYGFPTMQAFHTYQSARQGFDIEKENPTQNFEVLLVISLLLCLFEMLVMDETTSCLGSVDGSSLFCRRFQTWSCRGQHSDLTLRITAWLQIIHAACRRGGNAGILSHDLIKHIPPSSYVPPLKPLADFPHASCIIYENLHTALFSFNLELARLAAQVANLSHYHRSRTTPQDQDEATDLLSAFKHQLYALWDNRPGLMRLTPPQIRASVTKEIAEPLVTLVGISIASYHTEIIEIGRILSDPPLASPEARVAMGEIRAIVEGDWSSRSKADKINVGYLRPLFLCALEGFHLEDTQWAFRRLREIKDPISRSDFFASFGEQLAAAQRSKARRVTTRYFCYQTFGVFPPML